MPRPAASGQDSELSAVNRSSGRWIEISPLLLDAISLAVRAAELSDGAVDPLLGDRLCALGYDRDFDLLGHVPEETPLVRRSVSSTRRSGAWRMIELDHARASVRVPPHTQLDLGATAKALAADRAARAAHRACCSGVLVALGGDIATSGPAPEGGWPVRIADDHRDTRAEGPFVTIDGGGLATSSLVARRWRHSGVAVHHILDPATGDPAEPVWRTVSVCARSCAEANIASTAAVVLGESALSWLGRQALPARLVAVDGDVHPVGGWPR